MLLLLAALQLVALTTRAGGVFIVWGEWEVPNSSTCILCAVIHYAGLTVVLTSGQAAETAEELPVR
jgi:hypothetical protein